MKVLCLCYQLFLRDEQRITSNYLCNDVLHGQQHQQPKASSSQLLALLNAEDAEKLLNQIFFGRKLAESSLSRTLVSQQHDCFSQLPIELAEKVLSLLTHQDLLNLENVSLSLRQLVYDQRSWVFLLRQNMNTKPAWKRIVKHLDLSTQVMTPNLKAKDAKCLFIKIYSHEQNLLRKWNKLQIKERRITLSKPVKCFTMDDERLFIVSGHHNGNSEVQTFDRRTLNLEKVLYEPESIQTILNLTEDILVFGTDSGHVKILNWSTDILLGCLVHPKENSDVHDLAFSTGTLVSRSTPKIGGEHWSHIFIQQLSGCFSKVLKQEEIFIPGVRGTRVLLVDQFFLIHTVAEFWKDENQDGVIQVRKGEGWKLVHEIANLSLNDFHYASRLIIANLYYSIRIFEVETGLCRAMIAVESGLSASRFHFPFLAVNPLTNATKVKMWDLSSVLEDKTARGYDSQCIGDFPHKELDIPSHVHILFDELQVIVPNYSDKKYHLLIHDILPE